MLTFFLSFSVCSERPSVPAIIGRPLPRGGPRPHQPHPRGDLHALSDLPPLPSGLDRPSFVRENETEAEGAACEAALCADRLGCARGTLERNRAKGSQTEKICLHQRVQVRTRQ